MIPDLPRARLSQEPEYWERLASSVREDAAGPLAAYAMSDPEWYAVLARRAPWLVAASAAAMLILWLALPSRGSSTTFQWIESSLTPTEVAGTLVSGAAPPSVDALMVQFPPSEAEEQRQ